MGTKIEIYIPTLDSKLAEKILYDLVKYLREKYPIISSIVLTEVHHRYVVR